MPAPTWASGLRPKGLKVAHVPPGKITYLGGNPSCFENLHTSNKPKCEPAEHRRCLLLFTLSQYVRKLVRNHPFLTCAVDDLDRPRRQHVAHHRRLLECCALRTLHSEGFRDNRSLSSPRTCFTTPSVHHIPWLLLQM